MRNKKFTSSLKEKKQKKNLILIINNKQKELEITFKINLKQEVHTTLLYV
jgi:hypothetical protein